ncbi:CU044_5270 family protein [Streptomyces sp. NPDC016469]|uniref:CU044_5270 family protein n=1 Tax=Streptomyces sp. NPDC016469 TaxID=3157191 RepID=UPI0033C51C36
MTHENRPTDLIDFPGAAALERAGRTEPLDPAVQARAHALILDAIAADAAPGPVAVSRFGRRRVFALAAAVAAVAVGVAVLPVTDVGGDGPAASASASEVFTSMAGHITISDKYNAQTITDAYWKTTIRTWVEGGRAHTDDIYLGRDKVVIKTHNGRTVTKENPNGTSWQVGAGQIGWDDLNTLPTRPDALRRTLAAGAKGSAAEQTVRQAGELLTGAPASPRLRAALYRVLADTPGAVVTEGVKDAMGRTGTRISWKWKEKLPAHSAHDPNWIVQPSTGRLLERNYTPVGQDGHITDRDTYLYAGPAKTTG